jgi:hypothetical protein
MCDEVEGRTLESPKGSIGCDSWPSGGAPRGRACANKSVARRR